MTTAVTSSASLRIPQISELHLFLSASEATAFLLNNTADVVFVDMDLAGAEFVAAKELRKQHSTLPIIGVASMILSCLPISAFVSLRTELANTTTSIPPSAAMWRRWRASLAPMSSDELDAVYMQAQEAYDAFETLTDEEQIALADDLVKLRDVLDYMTTPVTPLATEAEIFTSQLSSITYTDGRFNISDTITIFIKLHTPMSAFRLFSFGKKLMED